MSDYSNIKPDWPKPSTTDFFSELSIGSWLHELTWFEKRCELLEAELKKRDELLSLDDALNIARGCTDYGGGYHDREEYDIFQHGIHTVINALEAAKTKGLKDSQVAALSAIGKEALNNE